MTIRYVRIGDIAEQVRGVTYAKADASDQPAPGREPILRANNITDEGLTYRDLVYVPASAIGPRQHVKQYDVVVAASSGSLAVVGKGAQAEADFPGGFGAFCKVLRPSKEVHPRYFGHYFLTKEYRQKVSSLAAGANINNLRNEHINDLLIRLPPLDEQRRIAAILDEADALRAKRREAIAKLDELPQAIFYEMFGDPVTNPMGWPMSTLEDISTRKGEYGAGLASKPLDPTLPRYVRITDVTDQGRLISEGVAPDGTEKEWGPYALSEGDLLFARSGATVGKTYLYRPADGPCVYAGYLIRFRPTEGVARPEYVFGYTKTEAYREWVQSKQRVVAQPNINAQQYGRELQILMPPLRLQDTFVERVSTIRELYETEVRVVALLDGVFAATQQRAFRGEL